MGTVQSKLKEVGRRTSCRLDWPSPQGSCDSRLQQPLIATALKQLLFQDYNHFCFSTLRAGARPCGRRAGHAWLNEIVQKCLLQWSPLGSQMLLALRNMNLCSPTPIKCFRLRQLSPGEVGAPSLFAYVFNRALVFCTRS